MNEWIEQLKREYRNDELPEFKQEIEGISYTFADQSMPNTAWQSRYLNTQKTVSYSFHYVEDLSTARANLLHDLNHGCDGILLTWNRIPDLDQLFQDIRFEYLQTVICLPQEVDLTSILQWMNRNKPQNFYLESGLEEFSVSHPPVGYVVSGFDAYSSGANAWQELAYVAYFLDRFLQKKSLRAITLETGLGENMVMELAKYRALDWMVQALCEKNQHFPTIKIRCKTGWRNKTTYQVNDNQIRQTIEAICGFISGAHELCITPYDFAYATASDFTVRRMALNTVHILENEADLKVEKSLYQGSIILQHHARWLCEKVWAVIHATNDDTFQNQLQQEIEATNRLRKQGKKNSNQPLIQAKTLRNVTGVFGGNGVYFQNLKA
jgi:hypothetical protein